MALDISRRGLITGLVSFAVTAPAIVRAANLMPIKAMEAAPIIWRSDYGRGCWVYFLGYEGLFRLGADGNTWEYVTPEIVG